MLCISRIASQKSDRRNISPSIDTLDVNQLKRVSLTLFDQEHLNMVFISRLRQRLDSRRQNSHAVLHVSLHMSIIDAWRQKTIDEVLHLFGHPELRRTIHH